jgi:hypothetical protein
MLDKGRKLDTNLLGGENLKYGTEKTCVFLLNKLVSMMARETENSMDLVGDLLSESLETSQRLRDSVL